MKKVEKMKDGKKMTIEEPDVLDDVYDFIANIIE